MLAALTGLEGYDKLESYTKIPAGWEIGLSPVDEIPLKEEFGRCLTGGKKQNAIRGGGCQPSHAHSSPITPHRSLFRGQQIVDYLVQTYQQLISPISNTATHILDFYPPSEVMSAGFGNSPRAVEEHFSPPPVLGLPSMTILRSKKYLITIYKGRLLRVVWK